MATLSLRNVKKLYDRPPYIVEDFSLDIHDGEFIVFVGPSGCGKSTTLRMIAGLEEITSGTIEIDGKVVNHLPPRDRDIAMVFQSYALYPHMTVYDNMSFGLRLRGVSERDVTKRVRDTAELLGITHLLERKPKALSGGQRQRVAVGRAIVREPKCFLFDEPLSNLDAKLRAEMRVELKQLQQRLAATTVYVTHDQEEAMTLGDRLVVMNGGIIQQCGPALTVYQRPANRFVAEFVGSPSMNFLSGTLTAHDGKLWFDEGTGRIAIPKVKSPPLAPYVGREMVLGVRPEALQVGPFAQPAPDHELTMDLKLAQPLGERMELHLSTRRHPRVVALVPVRTDLRAGDVSSVRLDPEKLHFFEPGALGKSLLA